MKKCKHGITEEHCSMCSPHKLTIHEPYSITFDTKDGDRVRMRKIRKKVTYKSPKEIEIEEMVKRTYWGYSE